MENKIKVILPIINFILIYFVFNNFTDIGIVDGIGYSVTMTLLEILLFKKYLWKLAFVKKITQIDNIQGEWVGTIYSNFDNKNHDIEKVIIKQSFDRYKVVLETKESRSYSEINKIKINDFGRLEIEYLYKNETTANMRKKNPMHFGVAKLELKGDKLIGTYWTDREINNGINTRGTIEFTNQIKKGNYDLITLLDIFELF